jgi:hypothetical protein
MNSHLETIDDCSCSACKFTRLDGIIKSANTSNDKEG